MRTSTRFAALACAALSGSLAAQQRSTSPTVRPVPVHSGVVVAQPVPRPGPDLAPPPRYLIPTHRTRPAPPRMAPSDAPPARAVPVRLSGPAPDMTRGEDRVDFVDSSLRIPGAATARVGEPSASMADASNGWYTGNFFAARTTDGGNTWTHVAPGTRFGSGFCCDQRVISHPSGLTAWLLQYGVNFARIAIAKTPADAGNDVWAYYIDFDRASFGAPTSSFGVDFPDAGYTKNKLYFTINVGDLGCVGWSLDVQELLAATSGAGINFNFVAPGGWTMRLAQTAANDGPDPDHMYLARHGNRTNEIRLLDWDGDQTSTDRVVDIATWNNTRPFTSLCPDGADWLNRHGGQILGGYRIRDEIGFLWTSGPNGAQTRYHLRALRLNRADLSVIGEHEIGFPDTSCAYPAIAPNAAGHLGLAFAIGGGSRYPSIATAILDDFSNWDQGVVVEIGQSGTHSPAPNGNGEGIWGDYLSVHPKNVKDRMSFVATGQTQQGGRNDSDNEPRFMHFGRDAFAEGSTAGLIVRSEPAGVSIWVSHRDVHGRSTGTTPFYNRYPGNYGPIQVIAPETIQHNGETWAFQRWATATAPGDPLTEQALGQRVYTAPSLIGLDSDICEARYAVVQTLNVDATAAGTTIQVSPPDVTGSTGGVVPLTLTYERDTVVTLTAPAQAGSYTLLDWSIGGSPVLPVQQTLDVTMSADATAIAEFGDVGTVTPIGHPGCLGWLVIPEHDAEWAPELQGPRQGYPTTFTLEKALPNTPAVMLLGSTTSTWNGQPLPLDLGLIGMTGCFLNHDVWGSVSVTTNSVGQAETVATVPANAASVGIPTYSTFAVVIPFANPLGVSLSNSIEWRLGGVR